MIVSRLYANSHLHPKGNTIFIMASTSNTKELERHITAIRKQLELELNDSLPRKVGVIAKQLFSENFHRSGFVDVGLRPWQKSKRELAGDKGASVRYKTLTSSRNHLMRSTQYKPIKRVVVIENPVPYTSTHNESCTSCISTTNISPFVRLFNLSR